MAFSPIRYAIGASLLPSAIYGPFRSHTTPSILHRCAELVLRPIAITLPWSLADIWESVLRAVPKKKTSYSKKRSRQLAGKALKDVTTLNKCPGCGRIKRAHTLCVYCVYDVKEIFKQQSRELSTKEKSKPELETTIEEAPQQTSKDAPGSGPSGGQQGGTN